MLEKVFEHPIYNMNAQVYVNGIQVGDTRLTNQQLGVIKIYVGIYAQIILKGTTKKTNFWAKNKGLFSHNF